MTGDNSGGARNTGRIQTQLWVTAKANVQSGIGLIKEELGGRGGGNQPRSGANGY